MTSFSDSCWIMKDPLGATSVMTSATSVVSSDAFEVPAADIADTQPGSSPGALRLCGAPPPPACARIPAAPPTEGQLWLLLLLLRWRQLVLLLLLLLRCLVLLRRLVHLGWRRQFGGWLRRHDVHRLIQL
eukprot:COSAG01_NODE_22205_length_867_cov_0.919271_1_plen_130_part_00